MLERIGNNATCVARGEESEGGRRQVKEKSKGKDLGVPATFKSAQCAPCYSRVSQLRDVCL